MRGDTLIEVLLATAIIGFIFASTAAVMGFYGKGQRSSQEHSEASYILQGQIDSLRAHATSAEMAAILDGSSYKVFCMNAVDGMPVSLEGSDENTLQSLDGDALTAPSPYPAACTNGRYFMAIEAPTDGSGTFTFHARWEGLNSPKNEVVYSYRLHQLGAIVATLPTCPLASPVTYSFDPGGPKTSAVPGNNRVTGPSGVGPLSIGPFALALPSGGIPAWDDYTVTLNSYDTHDVGLPDVRLNEKWRAVYKDGSGNPTYTSPYSADVPATVAGGVRQGPPDVFTGVTIAAGTVSVTAEHINVGSDGFHVESATVSCP